MTDLVIIMALYQNDKFEYCVESINSILNQTYKDFDFFIVFNGELSVETEAYITALHDPRINLFRLQNNIGLAGALNFLLSIILKEPKYELIARMDADDISLPQRIDVQHAFLMANTDIMCVGSWYHEIDESGKIISNQRLPYKHDEIRKFFYKRSPVAHSSVMFRRGLIETAGYYPTYTLRLEDYALWGNALAKGLKFSNIPEYLLKFRVDRSFYNRRSGIRYGSRFIFTRFRVLRTLKAPLYSYVYSLLVGIVRMMPAFIVKSIYIFFRNQTDR
jgi:glycosyltransferase involved in cell wall biosynthesis